MLKSSKNNIYDTLDKEVNECMLELNMLQSGSGGKLFAAQLKAIYEKDAKYILDVIGALESMSDVYNNTAVDRKRNAVVEALNAFSLQMNTYVASMLDDSESDK